MIHPSAVVSPDAKIGNNVSIGPFCVVGPKVTLGDDCVLHSHVTLEGPATFGKGNEFFPFACIGGKTQDLKYVGEPTYLEVGNLFLCYSHVAHDCQLGDHIILSNSVGLAGHITVEDYAIVSGFAAVHQFCRIGQHCIIGGCSKVVQDVPPFMIIDGNPASTRGVNAIGLQRRGFSAEDMRALKNAYKKLFLKKDGSMPQGLSSLKATHDGDHANVRQLIEFIENSERGVTR